MELTFTVQAVCILSKAYAIVLLSKNNSKQSEPKDVTRFVAESVPIFVNGKPLTCISKPLVRFKAGESGCCSGFILPEVPENGFCCFAVLYRT